MENVMNRIVLFAACIASLALTACGSAHIVAPPAPVSVLDHELQPDSTLRVAHVFQLPKNTAPSAIALGSDGNMWFTTGRLAIGRITQSGKVTYFKASNRDSALNITRGPENDLWYTVLGFPEIDRMNASGTFRSFVVQGNPNDIVAGPDGNLWYTDFTLQGIGVTTTAGKFKEFTVPTSQAYPFDITNGPDGNLWFTELFGGKIGRITTAGVITEFPIPGSSEPAGITSAAGKIYATDLENSAIVQITPSGALTSYGAPQTLHFNLVISDARGDLAVGAGHEGAVCLFNPVTHVFSNFLKVPNPTGAASVGPYGMALDRHGDIWFTSALDDYIAVLKERP